MARKLQVPSGFGLAPCGDKYDAEVERMNLRYLKKEVGTVEWSRFNDDIKARRAADRAALSGAVKPEPIE